MYTYMHLQKNERPLTQLVNYLIDISTGMLHLVEKGLIHTVSIIYVTDSYTMNTVSPYHYAEFGST